MRKIDGGLGNKPEAKNATNASEDWEPETMEMQDHGDEDCSKVDV